MPLDVFITNFPLIQWKTRKYDVFRLTQQPAIGHSPSPHADQNVMRSRLGVSSSSTTRPNPTPAGVSLSGSGPAGPPPGIISGIQPAAAGPPKTSSTNVINRPAAHGSKSIRYTDNCFEQGYWDVFTGSCACVKRENAWKQYAWKTLFVCERLLRVKMSAWSTNFGDEIKSKKMCLRKYFPYFSWNACYVCENFKDVVFIRHRTKFQYIYSRFRIKLGNRWEFLDIWLRYFDWVLIVATNIGLTSQALNSFNLPHCQFIVAVLLVRLSVDCCH